MLYNGVVLTSIVVVEHPLDSSKVLFNGASNVNGTDATFLHKVEKSQENDENGNQYMEAVKLTIEEAKAIINGEGKSKPLFTIHGFWVEPEGYLMTVSALEGDEPNDGKDQFSEFNLIPVLWPSIGGDSGYQEDRVLSKVAGESFTLLKDKVDVFPSKSLICHSMGNRVLRHAASNGFKFDNIFMAAADVHFKIFWKDYISEAGGDENHQNFDGILIRRMLSTDDNNVPKGKIYVLHNGRDGALGYSSWVKNGITRLGQVGPYKRKNWAGWFVEDKSLIHEDIINYIEAKDCNPHLSLGTEKTEHSYHFFKFAIDFYESKKV